MRLWTSRLQLCRCVLHEGSAVLPPHVADVLIIWGSHSDVSLRFMNELHTQAVPCTIFHLMLLKRALDCAAGL